MSRFDNPFDKPVRAKPDRAIPTLDRVEQTGSTVVMQQVTGETGAEYAFFTLPNAHASAKVDDVKPVSVPKFILGKGYAPKNPPYSPTTISGDEKKLEDEAIAMSESGSDTEDPGTMNKDATPSVASQQQFFQQYKEKISLCLLNSEGTSVLDSIRLEERVIRIEKQLGSMDKTWYTVFTSLQRDAVDAYAAFLKQKYSLENCIRFIPMSEAVAVIPACELIDQAKRLNK